MGTAPRRGFTSHEPADEESDAISSRMEPNASEENVALTVQSVMKWMRDTGEVENYNMDVRDGRLILNVQFDPVFRWEVVDIKLDELFVWAVHES